MPRGRRAVLDFLLLALSFSVSVIAALDVGAAADPGLRAASGVLYLVILVLLLVLASWFIRGHLRRTRVLDGTRTGQGARTSTAP